MHNNSPNHGHAAVLEGTNNLALNKLTLQKLHTSHHHKIEKSTQNVEYWDTLRLLLLKQKLVDFSTMGKQLYPYALLSKSSDLPNHQPQ